MSLFVFFTRDISAKDIPRRQYSLGRIDIGQVEEVVAHGPETGQDLRERRHDQVLAVTAINDNSR